VRRLLRHLLVLAALAAGLAGAALAQGAYYDRFAYLGVESITAPISVTSASQCQRLNDRLQAKASEIAAAHEACLQAESGGRSPTLGAPDSQSACTKPACQALHDGLSAINAQAIKHDKLCEARLAQSNASKARAECLSRCEQVVTECNAECPMDQPAGAACHLACPTDRGCRTKCSN
jgi:hypothetical protein